MKDRTRTDTDAETGVTGLLDQQFRRSQSLNLDEYNMLIGFNENYNTYSHNS